MPESPPPAAVLDERCAECGGALALTAAIVYHGLTYHPDCATGVRPSPAPAQAPRPAGDRWPFGVPEFNCSGDL